MSYVELAEPKQVTTRKRTHCAWCGETIPKGAGGIWTRHYVFEAGPQTDHMHPECWAALHQMDRAEISCGWAVGDFIRGTVEWA